MDFDGTPTAENPTEDFAEGTWSVRLTGTNSITDDTKTRTDYLTATAPPPSAVLLDNFVDTDGTLLVDHTMDTGPGWVYGGGGTWEIQSNQAQNTVSGGDVPIQSDAGIADATGTITLEWAIPVNNCRSGIVANYQDDDTFWAFVARGSNGDFALLEYSSGSPTVRDSGGSLPFGPVSFELKVITNGDTITGYYNGTQVCTYTGAPRNLKTQTKWGLYNRGADGTSTLFGPFEVIA